MRVTTFAVAALTVMGSPAWAQSDNAGPADDSFTIGVGPASAPRYEGSDDSRIIPFGAIRGSISGIAFTTQGTGLYVDLIPRRNQTGGKFVLGPVAKANFNRSSLKSIDDPQIEALGKLDTAIELGAQIGYSQNGVITSDFDNLSLTVAAAYDVAGGHGDYVITPQVTYGTPLSTSVYVGVSASAAYVGNDYAQTYFGVTPAQSLASGLPAYTPDDGFKSYTLGAIGGVSLSGDLRRGLGLFVIGSYSRLLGDFKRSPVTRDAGQWIGAIGIGYTF